MRTKITTKTITWTTTDDLPSKRWYWYLVVGYVGLIVTVLFWVLQIWTGVAVTIVIIAALFAVQRRHPEKYHCKLTKDGIKINKLNYQLGDFRACVTYQPSRGREMLVLLPKKYLSMGTMVPLPDDESERERVVGAFADRLPLLEQHPYQSAMRVTDRIASWLGLA